MILTSRVRIVAVLAVAGSLSAIAQAQVVRDGRLYYPQGASIPRGESDIEREWLRAHPEFRAGGGAIDAVTSSPVGPLHCQAEFEPQEGIIIAWQGTTAQNAIQAEMAKRITVDAASKVYVVCNSASVQTTATSTLVSAGCNMSLVSFIIRTTDSIWMCDYGPRFIFEGDCRATVDHLYNRPTRVNDNVFPDYWAQTVRKQGFYQLGSGNSQIIHGGGNFHLDGGNNRAFSTRLIYNENNLPFTNTSGYDGHAFSEPTIQSIWSQYQGLNVTLVDPFPTSVDATQHIDMWMQPVDNNKIIISDWPNNVGSIQDVICDNTATLLASQGYTVYRIPAYSVGGVHYTYTNTVFCNNILLVPTYTGGVPSPAATNAAAIAVFQSALPPGKTAIGVNCQNIISLAGAIHCIVRLVPAPRGLPGVNGGLAPTAYLQKPNGGQTLTPGHQYTISWISDDDVSVSTVDLRLSTDGGATWPTTIASGLNPVGSFVWTVPNVNTAQARVRAVATDGVNNTGSDDSDADFTIGNPVAPCYANCDGSTTVPILNANDFQCFLNTFAAADTAANCDGSTAVPVLNANDFQCFLNAFAAGCS